MSSILPILRAWHLFHSRWTLETAPASLDPQETPQRRRQQSRQRKSHLHQQPQSRQRSPQLQLQPIFDFGPRRKRLFPVDGERATGLEEEEARLEEKRSPDAMGWLVAHGLQRILSVVMPAKHTSSRIKSVSFKIGQLFLRAACSDTLVNGW